jgi:serine/threonine protein kinase
MLECAEKGTLADYIKSKSPNYRSKISIGLDVIKGLDFLHQHRIVHCDVAPTNILIFAEPEVANTSALGIEPVFAKLCDFGSAVILADYPPGSRFKCRIGTLPWISPELNHPLEIEISLLPKADVYSFGLVMVSTFMDGVVPSDFDSRGGDADLAYSTVLETHSTCQTLSATDRICSYALNPDISSETGTTSRLELNIRLIAHSALAGHPL